MEGEEKEDVIDRENASLRRLFNDVSREGAKRILVSHLVVVEEGEY